jgi:hypothetical protein
LACFGETQNPLKNFIPLWKENKIFLIFIKWVIEKLKLNSNNTQAFKDERF